MGGHWDVLYLAVGRQDVTLHHESLTMRFCWAFVIVGSCSFLLCGRVALQGQANRGWAEAHEKIARMTLTIKLDRNWSSFQLANSAPPLSVTDSAIAPSARIASAKRVQNSSIVFAMRAPCLSPGRHGATGNLGESLQKDGTTL